MLTISDSVTSNSSFDIWEFQSMNVSQFHKQTVWYVPSAYPDLYMTLHTCMSMILGYWYVVWAVQSSLIMTDGDFIRFPSKSICLSVNSLEFAVIRSCLWRTCVFAQCPHRSWLLHTQAALGATACQCSKRGWHPASVGLGQMCRMLSALAVHSRFSSVLANSRRACHTEHWWFRSPN